MTIKLELLATAWHQALANVTSHEVVLRQHLNSDYLATKERLETTITHYRSELDRLEGCLPSDIVSRLKAGSNVPDAVYPPVTAQNVLPGGAGDPA